MKELTHEEAVTSVRALAEVLEKTKGQLNNKQRKSLVRAVLKTVAPGKSKGAPVSR
jgi:hypothetical protein